MHASPLKPPQACVSVDADPEDTDRWRWIVTVPSCAGEPLFEQGGVAHSRIEAEALAAAAHAEFESSWRAATLQLLQTAGDADATGSHAGRDKVQAC